MTVNKSQGQSFNYVGVDLWIPPFTRGQLYVALSRVTNIAILLYTQKYYSIARMTTFYFNFNSIRAPQAITAEGGRGSRGSPPVSGTHSGSDRTIASTASNEI